MYLLPPANVVCEGYVFTSVCLSTGGGAIPAFIAGGIPACLAVGGAIPAFIASGIPACLAVGGCAIPAFIASGIPACLAAGGSPPGGLLLGSGLLF